MFFTLTPPTGLKIQMNTWNVIPAMILLIYLPLIYTTAALIMLRY